MVLRINVAAGIDTIQIKTRDITYVDPFLWCMILWRMKWETTGIQRW